MPGGPGDQETPRAGYRQGRPGPVGEGDRLGDAAPGQPGTQLVRLNRFEQARRPAGGLRPGCAAFHHRNRPASHRAMQRGAQTQRTGPDHHDIGVLVRPYPGMPDGDGDAYINPEFFHEQFCADLPDALAAVMAVSQRPVTLSCLGTPSGPAGWKTLPSWYMVASNDNAIPPVAGAGDGSPGRCAHGRDQQLPRCLHQPPAGNHRSHTGRRTGQLTPPPGQQTVLSAFT